MINSPVLYIYIYIYNRTANHLTATFSKITISESGCVAAKWIEMAMEKEFFY
jgi:hypothetical protein